MDGKLYKIRPLKWRRTDNNQVRCDVSNGSYYITKHEGKIKVEYYFKEYYDEGYLFVDSIKEAKEWVEYDWLKRLLPDLMEIKPPNRN